MNNKRNIYIDTFPCPYMDKFIPSVAQTTLIERYKKVILENLLRLIDVAFNYLTSVNCSDTSSVL